MSNEPIETECGACGSLVLDYGDGRIEPVERDKRPPLTHVAIRLHGVVWSLPKPYRHHHILNQIIPKYSPWRYVDVEDKEQGFLDADGRFLTRKEALNNAVENGQLKNGTLIGSILTSEDLW